MRQKIRRKSILKVFKEGEAAEAPKIKILEKLKKATEFVYEKSPA